MARDPITSRWRDLMMEVIEPWRDAPNMLSGGVDSAAILSAQIALGGQPSIYTLRLGDHESTDFIVARSMAQTFALRFVPVVIPRLDDVLIRDVREMIKVLGTTRKTAVQCGQCVAYLSRAIASDGFSEALVGTGGVVEDCRACMVILHTKGEAAARDYRRKSLFDSMGDQMNGTLAMHRAATVNGIVMREPFSTQPFADYSLSLDMREINKPVQKGIALRAFPEFWKRGKWHRRNSSMQVNSGIRKWHDTLLVSEHNRRGSKRVVAVYNDIAKEMIDG